MPAWVGLLVFTYPALPKVTHDAKKVFNVCQAKGIDFAGLQFDTMVVAYPINPTGSDYSLEQLSAAVPLSCMSGNRQSWIEIGATELWQTIELPLIETLSLMETQGIQLDRVAPDAMDSKIAARIQEFTGANL